MSTAVALSSATPVYNPKPLRVGMLTAACPVVCDAEKIARDPDWQIFRWFEIAQQMGVNYLQVSAAPPPEISGVDPGTQLDPTPSHLNLTEELTDERAERILAESRASGVRVGELGCFVNMMDSNLEVRERYAEYMGKVLRAAVKLDVKIVCAFVGRDFNLSMDENEALFEEVMIPVLREAADLDRIMAFEHCPMPGWRPDTWHNNIVDTVDMWVRLWKIADKHGLGHVFRITLDPSHLLLMGQDPIAVINLLRRLGMQFLVISTHIKGQVMDPVGIARYGYVGGKQAQLAHAWEGQTSIAEHDLPGTATPDALAYLRGLKTWWEMFLFLCYHVLEIDPEVGSIIIEHEKPDFKEGPNLTFDQMMPLLAGVVGYTSGLNAAVAAQKELFRIMGEVNLKPQTVDHSLYSADEFLTAT